MSEERKRLRRAIFARCRERGIGDEARHDVQRRETGKGSLTEMSTDEMRQVLRALGGSAPARSELPAGPHTGKLRALWISAWYLGVVRSRSDAALAAFVCRQTGLGAARWATPAHLSGAVEALKDWMAREAGVDWSPYRVGRRRVQRPGARVLEALWLKLHAAGAVGSADTQALSAWVVGYRREAGEYSGLPASTLNQLVRALGELVRDWTARTQGPA